MWHTGPDMSGRRCTQMEGSQTACNARTAAVPVVMRTASRSVPSCEPCSRTESTRMNRIAICLQRYPTERASPGREQATTRASTKLRQVAPEERDQLGTGRHGACALRRPVFDWPVFTDRAGVALGLARLLSRADQQQLPQPFSGSVRCCSARCRTHRLKPSVASMPQSAPRRSIRRFAPISNLC
jgi:hypothetical protein